MQKIAERGMLQNFIRQLEFYLTVLKICLCLKRKHIVNLKMSIQSMTDSPSCRAAQTNRVGGLILRR